MAEQRGIERLTAKEVKNAPPGKVMSDGGGLYLRADKLPDGSVRRVWLFRYSSPVHRILGPEGNITAVGKRREAGLGNCAHVSLLSVRAIAAKYRDDIKAGVDPLDEIEAKARIKAEEKQAAATAKHAQQTRERTTLRRIVREYHERIIEPDRTTKHGRQWINSIEQHVPASMLDCPVEDIEPTDLLDMLVTLRRQVPETARRVAQRIGVALADAKLRKIISTNPMADIQHALRQSKRDRQKVQGNFAALPYAEVPALMKSLAASEGIAPLALAFTIRTAARTAETLHATWSEFDLEEGVWKVPAARMKARQVHTVHLPKPAVAILKQLAKIKARPYVFPSPANLKRPLSNMAMLNVLRRLELDERTTVHGLRAAFSSWAYEVAQRSRPELARTDVVEACLAHRELDRIKAAYNRAEFEDDRKELLALWSDFVDSKPAPVFDIKRGAKGAA